MGSSASRARLRSSAAPSAHAESAVTPTSHSECSTCRDGVGSDTAHDIWWIPGERELPRRLLDLRRMCVIETAALCDVCASGVRYAFVSHVWGPVTTYLQCHDLGITGAATWPLPVSTPGKISSMLGTLAPLAREADIRYLWLDLLCIAQAPVGRIDPAQRDGNAPDTTPSRESGSSVSVSKQDVPTAWSGGAQSAAMSESASLRDRSIQAPLAPFFLRNAALAYLWLEGPLPSLALPELARLHGRIRHVFPPESHASLEVSFAELDVPAHLHDAILQVGQLLQEVSHDPWFTRVWTLQEGSLPHHRVMVSPAAGQCDAEKLLELAQAIRGLICSPARPGDGLRADLAALDGESIYWLGVALSRGAARLSVSNALWSTHHRDTTVLHDRVVAMLGLLDLGTMPVFGPDFYQKLSPQDCLCDVFECVRGHMLSSLLNFRGARGESGRYPFLPSIDPEDAVVLPSDDYVWAPCRLDMLQRRLHANGLASCGGTMQYVSPLPAVPSKALQESLLQAAIPSALIEYAFMQYDVIRHYTRTAGVVFGACEVALRGLTAIAWWATDEIIDPADLRDPDLQLHVIAWHRRAHGMFAAVLHVPADRAGRRVIAAGSALLDVAFEDGASFQGVALDVIAVAA
eukprot:m.66785 g.66785  ORF g.66785 m.66785 type:complete len:633 (+) comp7423_c0_seq1:1689-3587(+)